jgi:molybdopterin/thiamine biosynthesis adenylyltransferase
MQNASVLLVGIKGLLCEVAKNLTLAGVGSITLWDDATVSETDLDAIPMVRTEDVGSKARIRHR